MTMLLWGLGAVVFEFGLGYVLGYGFCWLVDRWRK